MVNGNVNDDDEIKTKRITRAIVVTNKLLLYDIILLKVYGWKKMYQYFLITFVLHCNGFTESSAGKNEDRLVVEPETIIGK